MGLDDYERGLNKRGRGDAPTMAKRLKEKGVMPDIIISSSARRARKTAKLLAKGLGFNKKIKLHDTLYEAMPSDLHYHIKSIKDKHEIAFLIGHNPELNMLAEEFVGFDENIVTCGIVEIEFNCETWSEIDSSNAKFISYDYPKSME